MKRSLGFQKSCLVQVLLHCTFLWLPQAYADVVNVIATSDGHSHSLGHHHHSTHHGDLGHLSRAELLSQLRNPFHTGGLADTLGLSGQHNFGGEEHRLLDALRTNNLQLSSILGGGGSSSGGISLSGGRNPQNLLSQLGIGGGNGLNLAGLGVGGGTAGVGSAGVGGGTAGVGSGGAGGGNLNIQANLGRNPGRRRPGPGGGSFFQLLSDKVRFVGLGTRIALNSGRFLTRWFDTAVDGVSGIAESVLGDVMDGGGGGQVSISGNLGTGGGGAGLGGLLGSRPRPGAGQRPVVNIIHLGGRHPSSGGLGLGHGHHDFGWGNHLHHHHPHSFDHLQGHHLHDHLQPIGSHQHGIPVIEDAQNLNQFLPANSNDYLFGQHGQDHHHSDHPGVSNIQGAINSMHHQPQNFQQLGHSDSDPESLPEESRFRLNSGLDLTNVPEFKPMPEDDE